MALILRALTPAGSLWLVAALALVVPGPALAATGVSAGTSSRPPAATQGAFAPPGRAIHGSISAAGAPPLTRPGLYEDSLAHGSSSVTAGGSAKFYAIKLGRGQHVYISATLTTPQSSAPSSAQLGLRIALTDRARSGCEIDSDQAFGSELGNVVAPLTAVLATGDVGGPNWNPECPKHATFAVEVIRSGQAYTAQSLPLEIGFHRQPPVLSGGPAGPAPAGGAVNLSAGPEQPTPITAGYGFDDAPVLLSGRYSDTIVSGQTRYFRIPLTWGQRVGFLLDGEPTRGKGALAFATLANPVRQPVSIDGGVDPQLDGDFGDVSGSSDIQGSSDYAVRYVNRESGKSEVAPSSIAGDYYLALTLGYPDARTVLTVGYSLIVDIVGTAQAGPSFEISGPAGQSSGASSRGAALWIVVGLVVALAVVGALALRRRRPAAHGPGSAPTGTFPGPPRPPQEALAAQVQPWWSSEVPRQARHAAPDATSDDPPPGPPGPEQRG